MKTATVHSVFFFVTDLDRSKAFYHKLLDIEPVEQGPSMAAFDIGGVQLLIHRDGDTPRVPAGSERGAGVALHIQVEGIHALWDRLNSLGIPLEEEPTVQPYGVTEFAIKDPDGYEVEFVEPVSP